MDGGGGTGRSSPESDRTSSSSPDEPIRSVLRPINVARASDASEGIDIRIFNDFEAQQQQQQSDADHRLPPEVAASRGQIHILDSQPSMPVHHSAHVEPAPRKVLSFAPSRFKPQQTAFSGPQPMADAFSGPQVKTTTFSGPQPKAFSRLRQSEQSGGGAQSDSPRTPGGTRTPGAYDLFKTRSRKFSGPLEKLEKNSGPLGRQLTRIITRRRPTQEPDHADDVVDVEQQKEQSQQQRHEEENGGGMHAAVSAGRYFDALSGPELEDVKDKETLLLPADEKWPFLLRFPIGSFGIALGLGSQTMLWKTLAQVPEITTFLRVPLWINLVLWCLALLVLIVVFVTYFLKIQYYFEAVRREYHHPVRVNFFFAPWIAAMFLAIGVPPSIAATVHPAVWCCFMFPVFCLELKIYGQWLSGGQRRLSKVANPSTHLSVVGNFVGSALAATVGWKEPAIFFWAVGLAHYLVLFVTLYQRLPTNETLPNDLHPVFFLFVAAPSAASVAWMRIVGEFDYVSRLVFFIALFLYSSLIVRINFFRGFKFSIAWWAYTFPMTAAAIASIQYCHVATSWITRALALALSFISSATVATLFISTLLHVFWWRCLFPNDLAIAITAYKSKMAFLRKESENDDGCGLYSLHHSEPLYKSMLDAYHHFLETREHHELSFVGNDPGKAASESPESGSLIDNHNAVEDHDHLHRSTTV